MNNTNEDHMPNSFLSAILYIMLIFFSCTLIALMSLRVENAAATAIKNTDISGIVGDTEISHYITSQLNMLPFHDVNLKLSDIEEFIQSEAVSNEIGGVLGGYVDAFVSGDSDYYLTEQDIVSIAQNLDEELYELFDHQMTEDDYALMARTLDDIVGFEGLTIEGLLGEIGVDIGIDLAIVRLLLSPHLLWGMILLCVVTALIALLLYRGNIDDTLLLVGVSIILSGLICLIAGVLFAMYPWMLGSRIERIARYAGGFGYVVKHNSIIMLVIATLFLILRFILYSIRRCKLRRR